MMINYKEINKNTKFDGYYIPNKGILINLEKGKNYYNKFDYKSRFWQIKMDNDIIPITVVSTPRDHYEWMVMPVGLKNAPKIFQRKIDKIFSEYLNFIIVYIDDILICSENKDDHEKHLDIFITLCKEKFYLHPIYFSLHPIYFSIHPIKNTHREKYKFTIKPIYFLFLSFSSSLCAPQLPFSSEVASFEKIVRMGENGLEK